MFDHVPSKHNFHRMCTIISKIKRSKVWSLYMTLKFLATAKLFFGILYALMVEKLWTQDSEYRPMDSCILRISRQSELRHKTRRQVWGSWRLWRRAGRGGTLAATVRNIPRIPEAASRGPGRRPWLQPAVTLPSPSLASFRTRTRGRGTPAQLLLFVSLANLATPALETLDGLKRQDSCSCRYCFLQSFGVKYENRTEKYFTEKASKVPRCRSSGWCLPLNLSTSDQSWLLAPGCRWRGQKFQKCGGYIPHQHQHQPQGLNPTAAAKFWCSPHKYLPTFWRSIHRLFEIYFCFTHMYKNQVVRISKN